eukprot:XP_010665042.1 PREDICTED: mucin-7-like [Vitis vinifera]
MAGLLHFEEKVHRKQLQRADTIPLLFMRLICYILEHMGYPTEPHLERRHHCREYFTHDKWTQLAGYSAPVAPPPKLASPVAPQAEQQDELPTEFVPPSPAAPPMPEATSTDPPATPHVPPVAPPTSEASITISAMEFCAMDQHTAIIPHIQQHLGLLPPPQTDIPGPSEPITPAKETTRANVPPQATQEATIEPSSPPESPAT